MKESFWNKRFLNSLIKTEKVGMAEKFVGYLLGPLGGLLTSQVFIVYLNTYWTDVLKINGSSAFLATFPLISIVFIVIGNLMAGRLIDSCATAQGKARPVLLISAPLLALAAVMLFAVPEASPTVQMIWIAVSYNLYYSVAFPLYNTANASTLSLSTRDSGERGPISVINSMALLGASSFATLILPMIVPMLGVDRSAWLSIMVVFAGFSLICVVLQYYFIRERITEENILLGIKEKKLPLKQQLKAVMSEKYWWMIILYFLVFLLVGNMQNFSMVYYCNYILGTYQDGYTQTILGVVTGIPLALGMCYSWPLAKRFGKRNTAMVGLLISVAGCLLAMLAPRSWFVVAIGLFIKCLGSAPANYIMMALFADVLDHVEARFSFRCDGFSMSLRSIIMATALSVCQGIFNGLLAITGYKAPDELLGAFEQNAATESVIIWCYIGVMMVGYVICALTLLPLNVEKEIERDQQIIRERQERSQHEQNIQ